MAPAILGAATWRAQTLLRGSLGAGQHLSAGPEATTWPHVPARERGGLPLWLRARSPSRPQLQRSQRGEHVAAFPSPGLSLGVALRGSLRPPPLPPPLQRLGRELEELLP